MGFVHGMPSVADLGRRLKPRRAAAGLPPLILMTDVRRLPDPTGLLDRLPGGSALILRHTDAGRLRVLAERLAPLCRARRLRLLIAGNARLAVTVPGAGGLHLPENQLRAGGRRWRRWRRPGWLVTAAAHSRAAVRRAAAAGVDALLLSPVFATASHPGAAPLGVLRFARLAGESPLPVYALGGVTRANARRLRGSGAVGIAAIGGIAGDPARQPSADVAAESAAAVS
jgi:thiamine-phosphate pyrophosphorylase